MAIAVAPAAGQTSEGTVITNTATVNWTDANGNTYTPGERRRVGHGGLPGRFVSHARRRIAESRVPRHRWHDDVDRPDFDLETSQIPGGVLSVVSITGTSVTQGANPDSARVSGLGSSASVDVTVTFNMANVAAGTVDSLFFLATSVRQPSTNAEGAYIVTVTKPGVTITNEASRTSD